MPSVGFREVNDYSDVRANGRTRTIAHAWQIPRDTENVVFGTRSVERFGLKTVLFLITVQLLELSY